MSYLRARGREANPGPRFSNGGSPREIHRNMYRSEQDEGIGGIKSVSGEAASAKSGVSLKRTPKKRKQERPRRSTFEISVGNLCFIISRLLFTRLTLPPCHGCPWKQKHGREESHVHTPRDRIGFCLQAEQRYCGITLF